MEEDQFGNVGFVGMQRVPLMFDVRTLFSELMGSARDELKCNSIEDDILIEGILHHGRSGTIFRRFVPIVSEVQWDKYVKTIMKSEFKCLDLVVRNLSKEPGHLVDSPLNWQPPIGPLVDNPASGFSSIAAFARRTRSSFFSLSSRAAATRLLSSSSLCSLF